MTVTRGNNFSLVINIQTSGTCDLFSGVFNQDPTTGLAQVALQTNPTWSVSAGGPIQLYQANLTSPQPALNTLLQQYGGLPPDLTVGNTLPAGVYTIGGTVTYRGGGTPQVLTLAPFTLTLNDNPPVAVVISTNSTFASESGAQSPYGAPVTARIQLADGTIVQTAPYAFSWTITDPNGNAVSQNATNPNATVWADLFEHRLQHDELRGRVQYVL